MNSVFNLAILDTNSSNVQNDLLLGIETDSYKFLLKGLIYHFIPTNFLNAPITYYKYIHTDYRTTYGDISVLLHLFSIIGIPMGIIQFDFINSCNKQFYRLIQYYMCFQTNIHMHS